MLTPPSYSSLFPYTSFFFFFFNDTATTEIYTLSLHDALPILNANRLFLMPGIIMEILEKLPLMFDSLPTHVFWRSEEHTSELQSHSDLVCRLLLEIRRAHV